MELSIMFLFVSSGKHERVMYTPLNPTYMRFAGVYLIFFLIQNIHCGYSLEPPQQGDSNVYPQFMF